MPLSGIEQISFTYELNHYTIDKPFRAMLKYNLGEEPHLHDLGSFTGREVYEVSYYVDRLAHPVLVNWNVLNENADISLLDPSERSVITQLMTRYRVNSPPFNGKSWHEHYAGIYLIGDPGIACILTITIQTAYALYKYGSSLRDYYKNLIGEREPIMFGATWFTEPQGGSDLGANKTIAHEERPHVWRLAGYKYFASGAGIADLALTTARTKDSKPGAKGISLFIVPRINSEGRLNFRVRRLKWKSGTIAVPTGEVEFQNAEAYLIGEKDKGIYYTMEDLIESRIANALGALAIARKAYIEAYGYASTRRAFGKLIKEHKLLSRDLLEAEVKIEGGLAITLYTISLFDSVWREEYPYNELYHFTRLLTHVIKNITADIASEVTKKAMEVFGGIGFLHEFPVEKWHREALITPIWEGTSNIQALDMLEVMVKKKAHEMLIEKVEGLARNQRNPKLAERAEEHVKEALKRALQDPGNAEWFAKSILERIGVGLSTLLLLDMSRGLSDSLFEEIAELYFLLSSERDTRRVDDSSVREIISLRGELEKIDWEAKVISP